MPSADPAALKERVVKAVDELADRLIEVSHEIHSHPELCYEERFAHNLLTDLLSQEGLEPERHAYGLETAFTARAGDSGPVVAVLCEYDALPEIGHACGHNIIAGSGVGAGLAAASIAADAGGTVVVIGTPAEEGGGGKAKLIARGAFVGVDAAMMVHPAGADMISMNGIAIQQLEVEYFGEAAHAAAFPQHGRNALDAAVLGYMNVAALRQHMRHDERVHGIFTRAGDKPNIVPSHTSALWYVRAKQLSTLEPLKARVITCLEAGALAAGCEMSHEWTEPAYADLVSNETIVARYASNAACLGRELGRPDAAAAVVGSTDMGNLSYVVPSIHPMIQVAPPEVVIHTPAFAEYAVSASGDQAVLDGAKALAMTVVDLWTDRALLDKAREEWAGRVGDE